MREPVWPRCASALFLRPSAVLRERSTPEACDYSRLSGVTHLKPFGFAFGLRRAPTAEPALRGFCRKKLGFFGRGVHGADTLRLRKTRTETVTRGRGCLREGLRAGSPWP
jgi:hypothetical protein